MIIRSWEEKDGCFFLIIGLFVKLCYVNVLIVLNLFMRCFLFFAFSFVCLVLVNVFVSFVVSGFLPFFSTKKSWFSLFGVWFCFLFFFFLEGLMII